MASVGLLLVDNQIGFEVPGYWGTERSNPNYEKNITALIEEFRKTRADLTLQPNIWHVYHSSRNEASPFHQSKETIAFYPFAKPEGDEPVIKKDVNSSFIGTNLEDMLRKRGITSLYIAGATVDQCVSTTVRMASNLDITQQTDEHGNLQQGRVILVSDACFTFNKGGFDAETVHNVNVASLRDEFCEVLSTADVLEELSKLSK